MRKPACPRRLVGVVSERSRSGSEHARRQAHWHGNAEVSQGLNCVAGAAFWQGRAQISWQAQHFRKVKCRFRFARSSTDFVAGAALFARSSTDFVAGAAFSLAQAQISWQAQHFRQVKYRFRGRGCFSARSSTDFVAGAAFFARSSTDFVAGAAFSQGQQFRYR